MMLHGWPKQESEAALGEVFQGQQTRFKRVPLLPCGLSVTLSLKHLFNSHSLEALPQMLKTAAAEELTFPAQ
jgi:hypothetical protein